jgi:hypothetical protein
LLSAVLASWVGLTGSLLLFGACYFVATASLLINPALREMDAARKPPLISTANS